MDRFFAINFKVAFTLVALGIVILLSKYLNQYITGSLIGILTVPLLTSIHKYGVKATFIRPGFRFIIVNINH